MTEMNLLGSGIVTAQSSHLYPSGNRAVAWLHDCYRHLYSWTCGEPLHKRPWHYSWLATRDLYADLRRALPKLQGLVLDVGCGGKPYKDWAEQAAGYVGIDISPSSKADVLAACGEPWPFQDESFDAVLCTQVLEYVGLQRTLAEIHRVLKPGGYLVATVPFLHPLEPRNDSRRFTIRGLTQLFTGSYKVVDSHGQGRVGSVLGLLLLGWINASMNRHTWTRVLKGVCLPFWILFCALVNTIGCFLDQIDSTGLYYTNAMLVARKVQANSLHPSRANSGGC